MSWIIRNHFKKKSDTRHWKKLKGVHFLNPCETRNTLVHVLIRSGKLSSTFLIRYTQISYLTPLQTLSLQTLTLNFSNFSMVPFVRIWKDTYSTIISGKIMLGPYWGCTRVDTHSYWVNRNLQDAFEIFFFFCQLVTSDFIKTLSSNTNFWIKYLK